MFESALFRCFQTHVYVAGPGCDTFYVARHPLFFRLLRRVQVVCCPLNVRVFLLHKVQPNACIKTELKREPYNESHHPTLAFSSRFAGLRTVVNRLGTRDLSHAQPRRAQGGVRDQRRYRRPPHGPVRSGVWPRSRDALRGDPSSVHRYVQTVFI